MLKKFKKRRFPRIIKDFLLASDCCQVVIVVVVVVVVTNANSTWHKIITFWYCGTIAVTIKGNVREWKEGLKWKNKGMKLRK